MSTLQTSVYVGLPPIESETRKRHLPDKLFIYFQKKQVSQKCDVDDVRIVSDNGEGLWVRVTFSEPLGVQHVLAKAHHKICIDGETIPLEVRRYLPSACLPSDNSNSDNDNESFQLVELNDAHKESIGVCTVESHIKKAAAHTCTYDQSPSPGPRDILHEKPSSSRNAAINNLMTTHQTSSVGELSSGSRNSAQETPFQVCAQRGKGVEDTTDEDMYGRGYGFNDRDTHKQAPSCAGLQSVNTTPSQTAMQGGKDWDDTASEDMYGKGDDIQECDREKLVMDKGNPKHRQAASGDDRYQPSQSQSRDGCNQQQHRGVDNQRLRRPSPAAHGPKRRDEDHHLPRDANHSDDDPITSTTSQMGKENLHGPKADRENTGKKKTRKRRPGVDGRKGSTEDSSNPHGGEQKDDVQDEQEDDEEQVVEVKNVNLSTSDDFLKMYFENVRRSGGGGIKTFERDSKTGAIRLTFEDPKVASKVVDRKSHRIDGATLTVKLVLKKKPCPVKKRCLFLKGIPDGCSSELLLLFIENKSGMDEPKIQFGEMPGTAICTFPRDIPDIEKVIQRVSSKPLQEVYLTAEKVHESDCIVVQGLSSKTPLQLIELYFDNKKKSGGSGVREIEQGQGDGQAIIYFEDWKVVGDVLSRSKPHQLDGAELSVEEYNDFLGRLSPLDAPTPHIPKPVSLKVPEAVMEFIFGKGKHTKKKMIKELGKARALLQWPDGDNTKARLEPLLEDGRRQSSWLKWPQTSAAALTDFLGKCKTLRIPIPQPLWEDTISKIEQVDTKFYFIEPDARRHVVLLVGEQQDVDKGVADIDSIIKELKTKAEHDAQQTKEEVVLSSLKLQLFTICGIKEEIEKSFPDLKISVGTLQDNKMGLILEGTRKNVQDAELLMRRQMDNLDHVEFKTGFNKVQFVHDSCDKINEILGSQNIHAACIGSPPDGKITIYGATKKDTIQAKEYIDQEIQEDVIPVKQKFVIAGIGNQAGYQPSQSQSRDGCNQQQHCGVDNQRLRRPSPAVSAAHGPKQRDEDHHLLRDANHSDDDPITSNTSQMGKENLHGPKTDRENTGKKKTRKKQPGVDGRKGSTEDSSNPHGGEQKDDVQDEQEDDEEQVVEVKNVNLSTSDDFLKMYFENARRSGGGGIKTFERDSKTGAIRLTFEDPKVASKVVDRKSHKIDGTTLTVKLVLKKKPCPVKKRCLLLKGIPDGCSSELLLLFIENKSGMDEPKIQFGEMPGTAICTFPRDIPDIEKVIQRVSSKPLQEVYMTAEKVHESDCILVQGLSSKTPLQLIELYFDNKKKSGGSGVRQIEQGQGDGQAIIYFEDWKVVGDVLSRSKPHQLDGAELSVEEYNDFLGRLSPLDAPTPHIPKPVSLKVPEAVMEFIFGKGKHTKKKMIKELGKARALLHWPDGDNTKARLEPLLEDGQRQSSWLKWPQTSAAALTDFLGKCKTLRIPIPQPLWEDTISKIEQVDTKFYFIEPDARRHVVLLVGEQQDVDKGVADIDSIIKELKTKAEHDAQQTKEEVVLSSLKLQLFTICGIKDKIEKSFPDLKISVGTLLDNKMGLILEGTRKNVQDAELLMRRQMDNLDHVEFKTGINKVRFVHDICDNIHEILGSQNIHAACNGSPPDGKITIYGATKKDTIQAKEYIDQEIQEDVIPVKGPAVVAVLQSEKGKKLLGDIIKQKFVIAGIGNQAGSCIELAGFKANLKETKQKIIAFLKDNVIMKRGIPTSKNKILLITTFHGQYLTNLATQNAKYHVKIQPQMSGRSRGFAIQGNERGFEAAFQSISHLLARIKEQQYPVSKTGMAQLFREDKGKKFLESVEKECQCVINENGQEECDEEEEGDGIALKTPTAITEVLCRIALPDGCTLRVCKGDLTKQKVDCIVNAANVDLKHVGGLARAILEAGGPVIQTESDDIIKYRGQPLYVGEPVITSSGKLPCKNVIHVAGPIWPHWKAKRNLDKKPTHEERLLYDGIIQCLSMANEGKFQSIAIPAFSTGVYGFPVELAAKQILNAVAEFCRSEPNHSLTAISFTNHDQSTCNVFRQAVMDQFGNFEELEAGTDVDVAGAFGDPPMDEVPTVTSPRFTVSGQNTLNTQEGITITMKKGSITNETVDVLVNTAGSHMNLSNGKVSQAILQAAGPALQQECNTLMTTRGNIPAGAFLETGPANLGCRKIFHCVCKGYNQTESEESLKKLVGSLMEQAETNEMTSIAIPALGTGNLNYPADVSARAMYEAVFEFSRQHPNGVLKDVRFVVYDKDMTTIKGFEDEIHSLTTGAVRGAVGGVTGFIPSTRKLNKSGSKSSGVIDRQSYSQVQHDTMGMMQTKIGSVCLQVGRGDLVKETSHSIVNSVGPQLDLKGPVSQAILAIGGDSIKKECNDLRKKDQKKLIHVTKAGNLQCSFIFHVVTPRNPEEIKMIVAKTLQLAEDKRLKSISFPALGTGQASQRVASCASALLTAVGEFAVRKKPQHLHLIRLVIFQQDMLPGFQDALRLEVGTSYKQHKGLLSKGFDFARSTWSSLVSSGPAVDEETEGEELQETIILHICAMDMILVRKAADRIDQFQQEEYTSEDRYDEHGLVDKMTAEHRAAVKSIEKKCNVHIEFPRGQIYRVQGRIFNVKDACISMQELFTKMLKEETENQHSEHLWKEVQWKYSSSNGLEAYDPEVNAIIEKAYQTKQPSVSLNLEEGKVTINFQQMKETSIAGSLDINRVDLQKASTFEMPSNWIPMKKSEHFKMVSLKAGTPEYTAVSTQFQLSMGGAAQISEIERIQNQDLMIQYQARMAAIEARLGRSKIEETLYHGTDEQTCVEINKFGFNRSFCGKNATAYGNGTYFAVNASYSARPQYAKPNSLGTRHIYMTKVLVGDYTRASQSMITPPHKPNNPNQLYDSVVDNTNQPGIYVIFHDAQAYPEYLIKFQ